MKMKSQHKKSPQKSPKDVTPEHNAPAPGFFAQPEQQPGQEQEIGQTLTSPARAAGINAYLVVEDNVINQKLIVRLLEKLGYYADVAGNGEAALKALSQREAAPDRLTPALSSLLPTAQTSQVA